MGRLSFAEHCCPRCEEWCRDFERLERELLDTREKATRYLVNGRRLCGYLELPEAELLNQVTRSPSEHPGKARKKAVDG